MKYFQNVLFNREGIRVLVKKTDTHAIRFLELYIHIYRPNTIALQSVDGRRQRNIGNNEDSFMNS